MKTIKDALQASSIEQRRRILNNIAIDKDSKNFIVRGEAGETNGGSSSEARYYKIKNKPDSKDILINSFNFFNITNIIYNFSTNNPDGSGIMQAYIEMGLNSLIGENTYDISYVKVDTKEYLMKVGTTTTLIAKGDIYEAMDIYIQFMIDKYGSVPQEQIDEMKNQILDMYENCTKEEYESVINVFPANKR